MSKQPSSVPVDAAAGRTVGSKYDYNASIDIGTPLISSLPKQKSSHIPRDFFDDYLRRLDEEKHKAMLSREMEEMRRVDASLVNMMKKLDMQRVGSLDYISLEEEMGGAEPEHRLRMFLQQQEYEKKLLVSQLEMREEQLKQLLDVMKGNGKVDKQLISDISSSHPQSGDSPSADLPRMRNELEQLRRLYNKQTLELQTKDMKIEGLAKEVGDKTKSIEKLQIELDTAKRSKTDNSSDEEALKKDIERLKDEARRVVADKEKAINETEILKRSIQAKTQEWEKEKQRMELEHSTKLAAAQGNQAASGRVKEMETENMKAEVDRLKRQLDKSTADASVQDSNNKKLIASLETEIVKLKQDLAANKDSAKTIETLKKREQDLVRELEALRQVSRPGSNTQQVDRLQKELMDANTISQQQAMMIAQLKAELSSGNKGGGGGAPATGPAAAGIPQQMQKAQQEIDTLKQELQKANTQIAELKKAGGTGSQPGSNTQAADKMSKEVSELKTENMKLSGQLTILTKKSEDLEAKLKGMSAGGDSATKALEEEIKRLKDQIDLEEKKKQSLIIRFNEKIAERDEEIKQLKSASSGRPADGGAGGSGDPNLIKKCAQLEAEVNKLRTELQKAQLSRDEIKILESTQNVDAKIVQLKDALKKKNEAITFRMEETNQKTLKIAELEAKLSQSLNGNVDMKEITELREENDAIQQKFQEQIGLLAELTDKVEEYSALLRKNKIPFKA